MMVWVELSFLPDAASNTESPTAAMSGSFVHEYYICYVALTVRSRPQ